MKTTKSIVALLFMLLTAQAALAWYDPSTQRWLSRDPIGEPGFETLRTATAMPKIGIQIPRTSTRWVTRDSVSEGGVNLYEFVQNRPITLHDAHGLIALSPCQQAIADFLTAQDAYLSDPDNQEALEAYEAARQAMEAACNPPQLPPASPNCPVKPPVFTPPYQNNHGSFCANHPAICGGAIIITAICIAQPELCVPVLIIAK